MKNMTKVILGLVYVLAALSFWSLSLSATAHAQTTKPSPQPQATPRPPLPKLANGARGFNTKSKDATTRFIAIGGGYGAGENEDPLPKLKRRTAQGYYQWGLALYGLAMNEAIAAFEQAIRLNPKFADAYWKLGEAYSEYNELVSGESKWDNEECYRRAIAAFEQVRRLQPRRAGVYNNLGVLYFDTGQFAKAITAFQTGLRLNPKDGQNETTLMEWEFLSDAQIYVFIGDAYEQLDRNELALNSYQRAVQAGELFFDGNINERLGLVYEKLGDVDKAIAAYLAIDAEYYRYRPFELTRISLRLGLLYARKGNYEEAIKYLSAAAKGYEDDFLSLNANAPTAEEGKQVRADWEQQVSDSRMNLVFAKYNLGVAFLSLNQAEKAVSAFKEAIEADASNAEARFNLGVAYLSLGDKSGARQQAIALSQLDTEMKKELEELIDK